MTDATGEVTYSARYTPWGDTLESSGTGNLTFGYFGGLMDAATGLLYVGDGQYYDPSTGRFLTRGSNPNSPNPYLPFDPAGAMLGPLGVLALVLGSKKKKSKYYVLLFVLVFAITSGFALTACGGQEYNFSATITPVTTPIPSSTQSYIVNATATPTNGGPTEYYSAVVTGTPNLIPTILPDCATAVTPTPMTIDDELRNIYGVFLVDGINGTWSDKVEYKSYILAAVKKINEKLPFAAVFGGYKLVWGCPLNCGNALAYTYSDRIEFRAFFARWKENDTPGINTRFIIHEFGHAFDQRVCAALGCNDILKGPIRTNLKNDSATMKFLDRNSYGIPENKPGAPAFSGFAGGKDVWQFTAQGQEIFSKNPGEVWADMFLGWAYGNLATDRMNYMNDVMPNYLSLFN